MRYELERERGPRDTSHFNHASSAISLNPIYVLYQLGDVCVCVCMRMRVCLNLFMGFTLPCACPCVYECCYMCEYECANALPSPMPGIFIIHPIGFCHVSAFYFFLFILAVTFARSLAVLASWLAGCAAAIAFGHTHKSGSTMNGKLFFCMSVYACTFSVIWCIAQIWC